jgi:hypothetical protein
MFVFGVSFHALEIDPTQLGKLRFFSDVKLSIHILSLGLSACSYVSSVLAPRVCLHTSSSNIEFSRKSHLSELRPNAFQHKSLIYVPSTSFFFIILIFGGFVGRGSFCAGCS